MVESIIFEADVTEVDHILAKRRSTNLHEGEIEDCDFLWQGDGTDKRHWLHLKKFMNTLPVPAGFKSVSSLELFYSHKSSKTFVILGLISSSTGGANEVQIWEIYEGTMVCCQQLEVGEKANLFGIVEYNSYFYVVVGATFGREPDLGRLRLLQFDEQKKKLRCLWSDSSDQSKRINYLVSSAIKVLNISPIFPEDDGLPLQEDVTNGRFCPRVLPSKTVDVPSSPWILIGFKDKTFSIYSLSDSGNALQVVYNWSNISSPVSHTDLILAVTAFQSGTDITVVTGSWDKTVRFWCFKWTKSLQGYAWKLTPAETNERGEGSVKIFREHKKSVTAMASHVFAVPEMLEEEQNGVSSYHISKVMVTGSLDKSLIVWDLESQQVIRKLYGHTDQVQCIQIYDTKMDGLPPLIISSAKGKQLIFWSLISGEKVRVIDLAEEMPFFSVLVSDKGGLLVVGPSGSDTIIFNFDSVERIRRLKTNPVTAIDIFYPRENETNKALMNPLVIVGAIDATCSVFDYYSGGEQFDMKIAKCQSGRRTPRVTRTKQPMKSLNTTKETFFPLSKAVKDHDPHGHTDRINSAIIYTPSIPATDGSCDVLVITAAADNFIKVWRLDGTFVKTLGKHTLTTYPMTLYNPEVFTADPYLPPQYVTQCKRSEFITNTLVITGGRDCHIKIWDLFGSDEDNETSMAKFEINKAHAQFIRTLAVHYPRDDPCNPILISGAYDFIVSFWNLRTREKLYSIHDHNGNIFSVAIYNPYEHGLTTWRTENAILVTGCYDSNAFTWDFTSKPSLQERNVLDKNGCKSIVEVNKRHTLSRHKESVTDLAIYTPRSTNRKPLIATCSIDKLVMVWNLYTGELLQTLVGHTDRVCFMTIFNPPKYNYRKQVLSSSHKSTVSSYHVNSHPLDFPTIISGGDDSMNIVWEDTLYEKKFMPPREMINRAFAFDLKEDDWPLITAMAKDWEGRIFYENSHLFHLAIRHKRPDFLLKFRHYLKRVLTFMREYDTQFWMMDNDDSEITNSSEFDGNDASGEKNLKSMLDDTIISENGDSNAVGDKSFQLKPTALLLTKTDLPKEKDVSVSSSVHSLRRRVTRSTAAALNDAEVSQNSKEYKRKSTKNVQKIDSSLTMEDNEDGIPSVRVRSNAGENASLNINNSSSRKALSRKTFVKSVREDLLDHIPNLIPDWANKQSFVDEEGNSSIATDRVVNKETPSNRRELFKKTRSMLQSQRSISTLEPSQQEPTLDEISNEKQQQQTTSSRPPFLRSNSNITKASGRSHSGRFDSLLFNRPSLQRETSLEYLENRHNKNLLLHAIDQNDLISLRVILLCWAEILNVDMHDILTQRLYHPIYFFPENDLRLLAFIYPAEFQHFIMALRLIRNESSLLHQERARLDDTTRFEIQGTHSRCCRSNLVWGESIVSRSIITQEQFCSNSSEGEHSISTAGGNSSSGATISWGFILSLFLQIFETHHEGTRNSIEQPITSMLVPLKMHSDMRDLLDLFVLVAEQLNNVEIFDSDVGVMVLNYVWSYTSRSSHIVFSFMYVIFLGLHTLSVLLCETKSHIHREDNDPSNDALEQEEAFVERGKFCFWLLVGGLCLYAVKHVYRMIFGISKQNETSSHKSQTSMNSSNNQVSTTKSHVWTFFLSFMKSSVSIALVYGLISLYNSTPKVLSTPYFASTGIATTLVVNVLVIIGFCVYGIEEFAQAFEKFNNLSLHSLLLHFVFDIWNFLDAVIIIGGISGQILHMIFWGDSSVGRGFIALTAVLMWCKLLYYLRPFSRSGPLVVMITTIVFDIRNLLIVLVFVLCGFAQAFWLISQGDQNEHFKDLDVALYNAVLYMLGQNIAPDQIHSLFGKCLLIAFMLVMTLLLLNLLIALMGDTFSAVRDQGVARWRKEQACIILDNRFDSSNFELTTEVPDLLCPVSMRDSMEQVLRWIGDRLPNMIKSLLTRHQHPPYLHVLKYSAEVRSQPRIGYKKLRRLVALSRSQVLSFEDFVVHDETNKNNNSDDDWEEDQDLDDVL